MRQAQRRIVVVMILAVFAALVFCTGCGTIARYVGKRIQNDTIERVSVLEQKVKDIREDVEQRVAEAVKTPIVGIIVTLILGGGLAALCVFKFPTLVDEVIIGTIGLCGVLMVWAYRKPILWTALAAAIGLLGWKLARKYVLPKITNGE